MFVQFKMSQLACKTQQPLTSILRNDNMYSAARSALKLFPTRKKIASACGLKSHWISLASSPWIHGTDFLYITTIYRSRYPAQTLQKAQFHGLFVIRLFLNWLIVHEFQYLGHWILHQARLYTNFHRTGSCLSIYLR